jgi:hypothetical protein
MFENLKNSFNNGGKLDLISINGAESHQVGKDALLGYSRDFKIKHIR